ncbi:MAG: hypothetical protein B6I19_10655 [Bacteroidetes bacterium 4572_114]|nr:MAG: hypothetical protein B6I19_10655 [Bacteroidetes bacterium 4572_114]
MIFGFAGYYVYVRAMQAFSGIFSNTIPVLIIYIFLAISMPGRPGLFKKEGYPFLYLIRLRNSSCAN